MNTESYTNEPGMIASIATAITLSIFQWSKPFTPVKPMDGCCGCGKYTGWMSVPLAGNTIVFYRRKDGPWKNQRIRSREANYRWWSSQKIRGKCRWIEKSKYWTETTRGVQAHSHWTKLSRFQSTRYSQTCIFDVLWHDITLTQLIYYARLSHRKSPMNIEQFWLCVHLTYACSWLN